MVKDLETIINEEKKYLREELGKTIIERDETWPISKYTPYFTENKTTYKLLAKKYLKCDYKEHRQNIVHHINFDHSDNRLCNLVVLTKDEHQKVHWMFDPDYEEVHKKLSKASKGRVMSDEFRKKCSERMKKNNPMKRKEISSKVAATQKGKKLSEETKQKISAANKGKIVTQETRTKYSIAANKRNRDEKGRFIK